MAAWPIACAVLIVLVGLGVLGWNWMDGISSNRAQAQAGSCPDGDTTMRVVVTPDAQQAVTEAATAWNQAKMVVHAHCVHVTVDAVPSARMSDALMGRTDIGTVGGVPAAWIPEASLWTSGLVSHRPDLIAAPPQSVAHAGSGDYPFVCLSGPAVDDVQKRAAQTFREYLEEPAQQDILNRHGL